MQWFSWSTLFIVLFFLAACQVMPPSSKVQQADTDIAIAMNYLHRQQYTAAKRYLEMGYQITPKSPLLWDALAYYHETIGNLTLAAQEYQYAIHLNSHLGAVYNNYGVFLCRHEHYAKAREQFVRALKQTGYEHREVAYRNLKACCLGK